MKTWARILVCGLICGAVWVLLAAILVGVLGQEFLAAASRGAATSSGLSMFIVSVAAGLWAMWIYSLVSIAIGPGLKSAVVVGIAWWTMASLQSAKWMILEGIPGGAAMPLGIAILPAMVAATFVGAWLYDRQGSRR